MFARVLGLVVVTVVGASAGAEILYCKFIDGFKTNKINYDTNKDVVTTIVKGKAKKYPGVTERHDLPPFYGEGTSLIVLGGDVVALNFRYTGGTEYRDGMVYPFEAYWGSLPGKFHVNAFEQFFGEDPNLGPKGVCYTAAQPPSDGARMGGGSHGGDHNGKRGCEHSGNRGGRGGKGGEGGGKNR